MPSIHCSTRLEPRNGVSFRPTLGVPSRGTSIKLRFLKPSWPMVVVAMHRGAATHGGRTSTRAAASERAMLIDCPGNRSYLETTTLK